MMLKKYFLLICLTLLCIQYSSLTSAAVFKCIDDAGETVYSSKKCKGRAEDFTLIKEKVLPQQRQQSNNTIDQPSVDIYITDWCPYCKKAIAFLRSKNIAFKVHDIEKNAEAKARKQKLTPGFTGIPVAVINGKILKGFSPSRYEKALLL